MATHDPHVLGLLVTIGLSKLLSEAEKHRKDDETPQPIQEDVNFSQRLRVRADRARTNLTGDAYYVKNAVNEFTTTECSHCLHWLLKLAYEDGGRLDHVRALSGGHSRVFVQRTLDWLDFSRAEWRAADPFLKGEGSSGTVDEQEAFTDIFHHVFMVASEFWRRFVVV